MLSNLPAYSTPLLFPIYSGLQCSLPSYVNIITPMENLHEIVRDISAASFLANENTFSQVAKIIHNQWDNVRNGRDKESARSKHNI